MNIVELIIQEENCAIERDIYSAIGYGIGVIGLWNGSLWNRNFSCILRRSPCSVTCACGHLPRPFPLLLPPHHHHPQFHS